MNHRLGQIQFKPYYFVRKQKKFNVMVAKVPQILTILMIADSFLSGDLIFSIETNQGNAV